MTVIIAVKPSQTNHDWTTQDWFSLQCVTVTAVPLAASSRLSIHPAVNVEDMDSDSEQHAITSHHMPQIITPQDPNLKTLTVPRPPKLSRTRFGPAVINLVSKKSLNAVCGTSVEIICFVLELRKYCNMNFCDFEDLSFTVKYLSMWNTW